MTFLNVYDIIGLFAAVILAVIFARVLFWAMAPPACSDLPIDSVAEEPTNRHFLIDPETGKLLELPNGWAEMEDHKP